MLYNQTTVTRLQNNEYVSYYADVRKNVKLESQLTSIFNASKHVSGLYIANMCIYILLETF